MNQFIKTSPAFICAVLLISCTSSVPKEEPISQNPEDPYQPKEYVELKHPEWSKNASIYEVNIRQFTKEGTFKAFEEHLPRLKDLGVDILWLMPIHPIGELNRKGSVGSYYSVKDYYGVNPEFGTLEDFKALVNKIHELGMYVIIDWVANHSAWDNVLVETNPEWYTKTREGNFQPTPWYDWSDIIDFDYEKSGIRKYMTDVLKYWVAETDIDGYRCDVAGFIPVDFWDNVRKELDAIKPVFMLAEWESRDLHKKSFDMTYSWSLYNNLLKIAKENAGAGALYEYMAHHVNTFPRNAYRMTFTDNHDKNSWEGTPFSQFGDAYEACIVFCFTVDGMPLIYSGQEAGQNKQLAFFEKDLIDWKEHKHFDLFKTLLTLKKENKALWNGNSGGEMIKISNTNPQNVLSFAREKDGDKVLVFINFSNESAEFELENNYDAGNYSELFTKQNLELQGNDKLQIPAWQYLVLVKNK